MIGVEELAQLAEEVDIGDPLDWMDLNISKPHAYRMIAASVVEMYANKKDATDLAMMAVITHLIVENFVLNLKLLTLQKNDANI